LYPKKLRQEIAYKRILMKSSAVVILADLSGEKIIPDPTSPNFWEMRR
jgi:hypothetical protein